LTKTNSFLHQIVRILRKLNTDSAQHSSNKEHVIVKDKPVENP